MFKEIGPLEAQALPYCQFREIAKVVAGDLIRDLHWTAQQERSVLSQLVRKGLNSAANRFLNLI